MPLSTQFGIRTSVWDVILVSSTAGTGAASYTKPLSSKIRIKTNEFGIPIVLFTKVALRLTPMPSHALNPPERPFTNVTSVWVPWDVFADMIFHVASLLAPFVATVPVTGQAVSDDDMLLIDVFLH
jgi:hypothetical protein